jgi:Mg-chelatase subunit ChlD
MSLLPICGPCRTVIHLFSIAIILLGLAGTGRTQEGPGEIPGLAGSRTSYDPQKKSYLDGSTVLQTRVDLVLVPVSVTDKRDRSVVGLAKDDFRLLENSRPQLIHSVSLENEPSSIAIVLDLSDSMEPKIGRALQAIHALLANANADDEFLLVTFSDQPRVAAGFTSSSEDIERVLLTATVGGHTALIDAIDLATIKMQDAKSHRPYFGWGRQSQSRDRRKA